MFKLLFKVFLNVDTHSIRCVSFLSQLLVTRKYSVDINAIIDTDEDSVKPMKKMSKAMKAYLERAEEYGSYFSINIIVCYQNNNKSQFTKIVKLYSSINWLIQKVKKFKIQAHLIVSRHIYQEGKDRVWNWKASFGEYDGPKPRVLFAGRRNRKSRREQTVELRSSE